jgi:hypothetical protein
VPKRKTRYTLFGVRGRDYHTFFFFCINGIGRGVLPAPLPRWQKEKKNMKKKRH